jgi:NADPH2:quinone reductase
VHDVQAVVIDPSDGSLRYTGVSDPVPSPTQLLVQVRAAGLNRADLLARAGRYPAPSRSGSGQPVVAGAELAGEVIAVGSDVDGWSPGDRVMGRGAGYAELAAVDHRQAMPVPDDLGWEEAGALPVAALTMHDALRTNGGLVPGGTVLMHAATSGVGHVGLVLATRLGASVVLGASRSADKLAVLQDFLSKLSCTFVPIDTSRDDFVEAVRRETDGRGVDVIVDNVGASVLEGNVAASAIGGRIVQVGRLGGRRAEIDLDELARKRISLIGVTFRTRTRADVIDVVDRFLSDHRNDLGSIGPRVDRTFPLSAADDAQLALAEDVHVGKLVLVP